MKANEIYEPDRVVLNWEDFAAAFGRAKKMVAGRYKGVITERESDWLALQVVRMWLIEAIYNAVFRDTSRKSGK